VTLVSADAVIGEARSEFREIGRMFVAGTRDFQREAAKIAKEKTRWLPILPPIRSPTKHTNNTKVFGREDVEAGGEGRAGPLGHAGTAQSAGPTKSGNYDDQYNPMLQDWRVETESDRWFC
jgi:hypothetical protein